MSFFLLILALFVSTDATVKKSKKIHKKHTYYFGFNVPISTIGHLAALKYGDPEITTPLKELYNNHIIYTILTLSNLFSFTIQHRCSNEKYIFAYVWPFNLAIGPTTKKVDVLFLWPIPGLQLDFKFKKHYIFYIKINISQFFITDVYHLFTNNMPSQVIKNIKKSAAFMAIGWVNFEIGIMFRVRV